MPIYEYKCEKCGHVFESLQSINASSENVVCTECGSSNVTKLFSAFASSGGEKHSTTSGCLPRSGFSWG